MPLSLCFCSAFAWAQQGVSTTLPPQVVPLARSGHSDVKLDTPELSGHRISEKLNKRELIKADLKQEELKSLRLKGASSLGGTSGGGGSGVAFPDGQVKLVDLLDEAELAQAKQIGLSYDQVIQRYYKPQPYVRQLGQDDKNFFACAVQVLSSSTTVYPSLQPLIQILPKAQTVQIQFQIPVMPAGPQYDALPLKFPLLSSASALLSADRQVALATYVNDQVWVPARLYSRLDPTNRCGLSVHEALRHLNYAKILRRNLTQEEIEVATRYFMNRSQSSDTAMLVSVNSKLKDVNPTAADYEQLEKSSDTEATRLLAELEAMGGRPLASPCVYDPASKAWDSKHADLKSRFNAEQSLLESTFGPGDHETEYKEHSVKADQLLEELIALGGRPPDCFITEAQIRWDEQDKDLRHRISTLNNEASTYGAEALLSATQDPAIQGAEATGSAASLSVHIGLTEPTYGSIFWDVLTLKKVNPFFSR